MSVNPNSTSCDPTEPPSNVAHLEFMRRVPVSEFESLELTPLQLLIMQGTSFCNIDCTYCYLPNRQVAKRMSTETVDAVCADLMTAPFVGEQFTMAWHAGEPLVAGVPFYRHAVESAKRLEHRNCRVSHSIQTNATLVNDEWCDFFREADIRLGVSLDGPAFIHDRYRKTRGGNGTHARVLRGVERLRRHGIDFHVICVLTRDSLDYPDEIFRFFASSGVTRVGFNIDETEGIHEVSSMNEPRVGEAFRVFLTRFYELAASGGMEVREFELLRRVIRSGRFHKVNRQCLPFSILSVGTDGNVSAFSPELLSTRHARYDHFVFGNIHQQSFMSMLDSVHFRRVHNEIRAGVQRCRDSCEYFALCGGGAPSNKAFENGTFDSTETTTCRLTKQAVIDVVLSSIEQELGIPTN